MTSIRIRYCKENESVRHEVSRMMNRRKPSRQPYHLRNDSTVLLLIATFSVNPESLLPIPGLIYESDTQKVLTNNFLHFKRFSAFHSSISVLAPHFCQTTLPICHRHQLPSRHDTACSAPQPHQPIKSPELGPRMSYKAVSNLSVCLE